MKAGYFAFSILCYGIGEGSDHWEDARGCVHQLLQKAYECWPLPQSWVCVGGEADEDGLLMNWTVDAS